MADKNDRKHGESGWSILADIFDVGGDVIIEGVARAVSAMFEMWS